MENNNSRYDYFLIWGNGLEHKEGILKMINDEKSLEIIKIMEYQFEDINKFVKEIYSHDYAPYQHLKGKTKYLLTTLPKVIFIFVKNKNPDESFFGENEYRHIESKKIKKLKNEIRDKYNERKDERRTENHVVHASDNENQTDYILKYLGHTEGIDIFEPYSDIIHFSQLRNKGSYIIKKIPLVDLYSTIITGDLKNPKIITEIDNSPHFKFLEGQKKVYEDYTEKFKGIFLQDNHSIEKFDSLIKSFDYLDEDHPTNYIMVKSLEQGKYLVLDGLHRAAILKHKGLSHIIGAIIE